MCAALENLKEEGREEGLLVGREEGLLAGREEGLLAGREEGRLEAIQEFAGIFQELGIDNHVILEKIQEKFHLEREKALEILK